MEEFLDGEEASYFALIDGETCVALASAQVGPLQHDSERWKCLADDAYSGCKGSVQVKIALRAGS